MISTNDISKTDEYKAQRACLKKNHLLDSKIQPVIVQGIFKYQQILTNGIKLEICKLNYQEVLSKKMKIVMGILQKEHKQKSLTYIVKKCAFLHTFLHTGSETGMLNSEDVQFIMSQINELIQSDVTKLFQSSKPNPRPRNSLYKLYDYFRGSSETRNQERSKSKLKMQISSQKGAIKELSYKVIIPLCSYLLKISQEFLVYSKILKKKLPSDQEEQIKWKIMNYLSLLSQIVYQLNRLGKYYKQDLIGCWILIYYIISTDVYIYADIVSSSLGKIGQHWQQKIILIEKFAKISKNHRAELKNIYQDKQFSQLVKQIEVFVQYKQKLLYLYFNSKIKPYLCYFQRPQALTRTSKETEVFDFLLYSASQANSKLLIKKSDKNEYEKDSNNKKMGEVMRKRINSQPNQILSPNSTIMSTIRDRKPIQNTPQQKIPIFSSKNNDMLINSRANNFILAVKSKAMGK